MFNVHIHLKVKGQRNRISGKVWIPNSKTRGYRSSIIEAPGPSPSFSIHILHAAAKRPVSPVCVSQWDKGATVHFYSALAHSSSCMSSPPHHCDRQAARWKNPRKQREDMEKKRQAHIKIQEHIKDKQRYQMMLIVQPIRETLSACPHRRKRSSVDVSCRSHLLSCPWWKQLSGRNPPGTATGQIWAEC